MLGKTVRVSVQGTFVGGPTLPALKCLGVNRKQFHKSKIFSSAERQIILYLILTVKKGLISELEINCSSDMCSQKLIGQL